MSEKLSEDAVKRLIVAAAPERIKEFDALWKEFSPQIRFIEDKAGFCLEAGAFCLVIFNHKSMCQIWLLGFAAQYAFNAYLPYLLLSQVSNLPIASDDFKEDQETERLVNQARNLLVSVIDLENLSSLDEFKWPNGVPDPFKGKPNDANGGMVFDLLCIGAAYCFLHEIKHVMFNSGGSAIGRHEEEMQCDAFAREFLLANVENYSGESGDAADEVKTKRAMSIGLTVLLLLVLTPQKHWPGTDNHPSIFDRIVALTDSLHLCEESYFWSYLSSIVLLVMEHYSIEVCYPEISSPRKFCLLLLETLNSSS